jgi:hypothetical protein
VVIWNRYLPVHSVFVFSLPSLIVSSSSSSSSLPVLIEIITKAIPYPDLEMYDVAVKVANEQYTHPIPSNTPPGLDLVMHDCWQYEPDNRPSFAELWEHLAIISSEYMQWNSTNR